MSPPRGGRFFSTPSDYAEEAAFYQQVLIEACALLPRTLLETAFVHCRPGGAALFAPDHVKDSFRSSTSFGGHDGAGEALRYLEWTWDPDAADTTYLVDYAYLLRDRDGSVRVIHDRHTEGLFSRADWLRLLAGAGFESNAIPFAHSELEPGTYEVFVGRRPRDSSAADR